MVRGGCGLIIRCAKLVHSIASTPLPLMPSNPTPTSKRRPHVACTRPSPVAPRALPSPFHTNRAVCDERYGVTPICGFLFSSAFLCESLPSISLLAFSVNFSLGTFACCWYRFIPRVPYRGPCMVRHSKQADCVTLLSQFFALNMAVFSCHCHWDSTPIHVPFFVCSSSSPSPVEVQIHIRGSLPNNRLFFSTSSGPQPICLIDLRDGKPEIGFVNLPSLTHALHASQHAPSLATRVCAPRLVRQHAIAQVRAYKGAFPESSEVEPLVDLWNPCDDVVCKKHRWRVVC